jgi:mitochondrial inner membrane protease subunit 1
VHFFLECVGGPRIVSNLIRKRLEALLECKQCAGPSMLPTIGPYNEVVLEDRLTIRLANDPLTRLRRGDLVVATSPIDPKMTICKRILGLPGDVITVDPLATPESRRNEHVYIPEGHLWLVGDNASMSRDSRTYGPVPVGLVRAKLRASVSM